MNKALIIIPLPISFRIRCSCTTLIKKSKRDRPFKKKKKTLDALSYQEEVDVGQNILQLRRPAEGHHQTLVGFVAPDSGLFVVVVVVAMLIIVQV